METDVTKKLGDKIISAFAKEGVPSQNKSQFLKRLQNEETHEGERMHYLDFLKDKNDISHIYKLIKNKKLSNNQIKAKIKEFLKDPNHVRKFLEAILDHKTTKKEESKEATSSGGGAGAFVGPLTGGEEIQKKEIPTVREQAEQIEKVETKEATGSASSGQYSQPAIWAKSLNKKDWKGATTKYMPGSKRVQVKKKCKKFPYCNQGDIGALKIFENESVQSAIESVSGKYAIDKDYISEIVFQEIRKRQK